MSQLKESDIILQQIMNKAKGQKATAARSEAKKTKSRKNWTNALNLAFTLATAGSGSVLGGIVKGASKIGKLGQVLDKAKNLQKLVKVLDAGKKASRLGVYGTKLGNKFINRALSDVLVKDTDTMRKEDKLSGYGSDVLNVVSGYGKSFLPGATNPYTGVAFGEVKDNNLPTIASSVSPNTLPINQPVNLTLGQQSALNQQNNLLAGTSLSSTPYQRENIIGNIISQRPTGYSSGTPYFNLIDDNLE